MSVKLLTEHHLEFLSLKGGCTGSYESSNDTLLEITCHGSFIIRVCCSKFPNFFSFMITNRAYHDEEML